MIKRILAAILLTLYCHNSYSIMQPSHLKQNALVKDEFAHMALARGFLNALTHYAYNLYRYGSLKDKLKPVVKELFLLNNDNANFFIQTNSTQFTAHLTPYSIGVLVGILEHSKRGEDFSSLGSKNDPWGEVRLRKMLLAYLQTCPEIALWQEAITEKIAEEQASLKRTDSLTQEQQAAIEKNIALLKKYKEKPQIALNRFVDALAQAQISSKNTKSLHMHEAVQMLLLEYLCYKTDSRADIIEYYNGVCFAYPISLTQKGKEILSNADLQKEYIADLYKQADFLAYAACDDVGLKFSVLELEEVLLLLKTSYKLYYDPKPDELYFRTSYYTASDGTRHGFSDCGETALRNLFNAILFDSVTRQFNTTLLQQLKSQGYPVDKLIEYYSNFDINSMNFPKAYDAWANICADIPDVTYTDMPTYGLRCNISSRAPEGALSNIEKVLYSLTGCATFQELCSVLNAQSLTNSLGQRLIFELKQDPHNDITHSDLFFVISKNDHEGSVSKITAHLNCKYGHFKTVLASSTDSSNVSSLLRQNIPLLPRNIQALWDGMGYVDRDVHQENSKSLAYVYASALSSDLADDANFNAMLKELLQHPDFKHYAMGSDFINARYAQTPDDRTAQSCFFDALYDKNNKPENVGVLLKQLNLVYDSAHNVAIVQWFAHACEHYMNFIFTLLKKSNDAMLIFFGMKLCSGTNEMLYENRELLNYLKEKMEQLETKSDILIEIPQGLTLSGLIISRKYEPRASYLDPLLKHLLTNCSDKIVYNLENLISIIVEQGCTVYEDMVVEVLSKEDALLDSRKRYSIICKILALKSKYVFALFDSWLKKNINLSSNSMIDTQQYTLHILEIPYTEETRYLYNYVVQWALEERDPNLIDQDLIRQYVLNFISKDAQKYFNCIQHLAKYCNAWSKKFIIQQTMQWYTASLGILNPLFDSWIAEIT